MWKSIDAGEYKLFDGVPFPTQYEETYWGSSADSAQHVIRERKKISVTAAEFGKRYSDDIFKLTMHPNTLVTE